MSPRSDPSQRSVDRAVLHADEVVAMAAGRSLVLWGAGDDAPLLPPTVTEVVRYAGPGTLVGSFDSIVSLGQLAAATDLSALLDMLVAHIGPDGVLLFCEPTAAGNRANGDHGHDITGTLWAGDWSVIECRRFRVGRGRRAQEYCWGRARRTRFVGPRRRLAADQIESG